MGNPMKVSTWCQFFVAYLNENVCLVQKKLFTSLDDRETGLLFSLLYLTN